MYLVGIALINYISLKSFGDEILRVKMVRCISGICLVALNF
jgi:hypothetical protein